MNNFNKFLEFVTNENYFNNVINFVTSGEIFHTKFIAQSFPLYALSIGLLLFTIWSVNLKKITWYLLVIFDVFIIWIAITIHASSHILGLYVCGTAPEGLFAVLTLFSLLGGPFLGAVFVPSAMYGD
ncbi:hypothetical protein KC866_02760 [Patescibacteria group bacterium]|nr:hypothetical protein [Patescibacteria group bacterium]